MSAELGRRQLLDHFFRTGSPLDELELVKVSPQRDFVLLEERQRLAG